MPIKAETAGAKPSGCVLAAAMLIVAILAPLVRAEAAAGACPAATHPAKVAVSPMLPAPLEDRTTSYHDLTKEMSWKKMKPEEDAMGVSSSSLGYNLHTEFRIAAHGGHSCAYLTSLAVQFGYTRRLVQIAAEVPKDSCMYGEIREHEYKHVAVDNGIVRDNFAPVEAQIKALAASFAPVETADGAAAAKQLADALKLALRPTILHLEELANAAQEKVDTTAEYERVDNACRVFVDTSKPEPEAAPPTTPATPAPTPPSLKPGGK
jgi:hypothetical protein